MIEKVKKKLSENVILSITLRYMKLNRKRTLITFLGIMLMVTLMTCAFVGKDTALGYMEKLGSLKDGSWHVAVYNADHETLDTISNLDYVDETAYSADYGFTDFDLTSNSDRPYLYVKAYSENDFDWMNIHLSGGRLPENGSEIVISRAALDEGSPVAIGDVISADYFDRTIECTGKNGATITVLAYYGIALEYGGEPVKVSKDMCYWGDDSDDTPEIAESRIPLGRTAEYTVVGFIEPPAFESSSSADYIALTKLDDPSALEKCNMVFKYDHDRIKKSPNAVWELQDLVSASDLDFNNYVLSFSGLSSDQTVNALAVGTVVFFVVLIMLASILLIYNLFQISLDERSRWLGQLTAIGATRGQKRSSIYYECFMLLAAAVPAGLVLGTVLVLAGMNLLKPALGALANLESYTDRCPISLVFSWKAILLIIVMSCVTVLVSAFIPARRVGRIGPMESIRGNDSSKGAAHYALNEKQVSTLAPEKWLALICTKRQLRRNSGIIRAAAVFMVILIVTTFASGLISRVTDSVLGYTQKSEHYQDADFILYCYSEDKTEYDSFKDGLSQEKGIESLREYFVKPWAGTISYSVMSKEYDNAMTDIFEQCLGHAPDEQDRADYFSTVQLDVIILDNDSYNDLAKTAGAEAVSASDALTVPALIVDDGYTSTDYQAYGGVKAPKYKYYELRHMTSLSFGDTFESIDPFIEGDQTGYKVSIAGLISGDQLAKYADRINPDELLAIISRDSAEKLCGIGYDFISSSSAECVIRLNGLDPALEEQLNEMTDTNSEEITLMSLKYAASLSDAIAKIVRILLICFVAVVSVICLINLGNSIRSRLLERRQEFAAMRTIGITDTQLRKQLLLECVGHLLLATLISFALAAALTGLLFAAVNSLVGHLLFTVPWLAVILSVAISAAAVCGFTLLFFPSQKGASLVEEIRRSSI